MIENMANAKNFRLVHAPDVAHTQRVKHTLVHMEQNAQLLQDGYFSAYQIPRLPCSTSVILHLPSPTPISPMRA